MKRLIISSCIHKLFALVIIMVSAFSLDAETLSADSLLTHGPLSRPHQIFTDAELYQYELPTYDTKTYWVVNSANLDEEILEDDSFWGLLYNDFYRYYQGADINVSTELKKKVFEKSDLYSEMKNDMDFTRRILLSDTIHMPLRNFVNYARRYDVNRGGFVVIEELDSRLPPFYKKVTPTSKNNRNMSNWRISESRVAGPDYPKYFIIPKSLQNKIESVDGRSFSFFLPIANEDIALQIEDMNRPSDENFDLLLQFHYVQKPVPIVELVDIILLSNKDNNVIWTLIRGDLTKN